MTDLLQDVRAESPIHASDSSDTPMCSKPQRNAFTGFIFDPRPRVAERTPRPTKRGSAIDLSIPPRGSIADKTDPAIKRAKLLRGAMR